MAVGYRRLLGDPSFSVGIVAVAVSAVVLGMVPLTLVLGSPGRRLADGAVLAAAFGIGNALGVPSQGLLIARFPTRLVLLASTVASCTLLAAVAVVPAGGVRVALLTGAGLTFPAGAAAVRAAVPVAIRRPADRTGAYALLSVAFQARLATGPVAAGAIAVSDLRPVALVVAAGLLAAAGVLLVASMRLPVVVEGAHPGRVGRLDVPAFVRVVAIAAALGVASGSLTVIVPTTLRHAGVVGVSGAVLGALAVGEAVGALVVGAVRSPTSPRRRLLVALTLIAIGDAVLGFTADPVLLTVVVFGIGMVSSPAAIVLSTVLDDVVPSSFLASAYGFVVTAGVGGAANADDGPVVLAVLAATAAVALGATTARGPSR